MDMRKLIGLVILIHLAAGASEDDSVEAIQDGNDPSTKEADEVSVQLPTPTRLNLSSGTQPGLLDSHNTGPSFPNSSGIKTTNVPRFQELKTHDDFRDISLQVSNKRTRGTGRNFRKRRIPKNRSIAQEVPPYINTNLNIPHIHGKNKQDIEKPGLPDNHESGTLNSQKTIFPKFLRAKNTRDYTNIPQNHYFPNAVDTNVPQIPEINLPPKPSITPVELPIPRLPDTNITHTPPQTSSPEIEDVPQLKRSAVSNPDDPDNTLSEDQHLPTVEHPKISTENISAIIHTLIQNISDSKVPQIIEITLSPVTPVTPVELLTQKLPLTNNTSTPMQIDSHPETLYTPELELPSVNNINPSDSSVLQDRHIPELDTSEIVNSVTRNLSDVNIPQIPDFNIPPVPTTAPKELPIPELPLINTTPIPQISSPQTQNVPELEVPAANKPHYPDIPSPEDQDLPVVEHPKIPEINMSKIVNPVMQNISEAKVQQIPGISLPTIPALTQAELPFPKLPVPNATHIPQISSPQMKDVPEFNLQSFNKPNYPDIPVSQDHDLPNVGNPEIPKPNTPAIVNPVIQNMSDTKLPSIPDTSLPPITAITPAELPELPVPMLPLTNYTNIPQFSRPQITDIPLKQPAIIKPDDPDIPILESHDLAKVEHTKIPNLNTSKLANPEVQQSPDFKIPPVPTVTPIELPIPNFPLLNDTHLPQLSDPPTQEIPKLKLTAIIEPNITRPNDQDILIVEHPNISAIVSPFIQNKSDATVTQTPDFNISPVPTITPGELAVPKLPVTNVTHIPQISSFQSKDIPEVNLAVINKPNYPDIPMLQGHDLPNAENPEILKPNVSTIVNPEENAQIPGIILPPIPTMTPKEVPISDLQFTNITHAPEISGPQTQDIPKLNLTAIVKPRDLVITSSQGQDFPIAEHPKIPELNTSTVNQIVRNISDERIPQIPDTTLPPMTAIPPAEFPIPKLPLKNITNIPPISRPQIIDIPDLKQPTIIKPDDPGIPILESDGHPEVEHPQIPELNTSASVNPVIHNISNTKLHQIPDFYTPPVPTITPLELPMVKLPHANITHIPQINGPQRQDIAKLNLPPISKPDYPGIPMPEGHDLSTAENDEMSELDMSSLINPVIQKNISDTKLTPTPDIPLSPITPVTPVELSIKQLPVTNFTQIPQDFSPQIQNIPEFKAPPFSKPNYPDIPNPKSQDLVVEHPKLQVINMSIIVNPVVQNTSHSEVQQIPGIDLPHIPAITQNELPIPELTITNITHTIPKMSNTEIQEVPDLKQSVINKLNYPDTTVVQGHDLPNTDNHEILKPNVSAIAKPVKIVQIPEIKLPPIPTIAPKELPISDPQFINVTDTPEIPSPQTQDILELNLTAVVKPEDIIIKSPTSKDIPIPDQPEIPKLNISTAVNPVISNMGDEIIPELPDTTLPPPLITRPPIENISELILPAVNKPNYPDIPIVEDLYLPNVEHPTIPRINMPTIVNPVIQNMSGITPTSIPAITPADLPVPNLPLADVTHIPQVSTRQMQDVPMVEYPEYQELNRSEREKPLFSDISGNQVPEIPDVELNDTRAIHPPGIVTPHLPEVNITHSQQFSNAEITPVPNLNLQDIIRHISSVNPETVNLKLPNISLPIFSQDDKLNLTNIPAFQGHAFPKDEPHLYLPIILANANKLNYSDIPGIKIPDIPNLNVSMVLTPVTLKVNDTTAPEIHYVHSPHSPPIAPLKLNLTNKSQRPILEIPAVPNLHLTLIASDCPE
ncbi:titin-like [Macrobrachium nipponense]|uniref:titin-like n=1 Tax=Macrobrachium nipponense TaxID=159736 RepID=UPI0030C8A685